MSHIKFDSSALTIDTIVVKKVSPFSGGTALLMDNTKVKVPPKYAKAFGDMYYTEGTKALVVKYNDDIINIAHENSTDVDAAIQTLKTFKDDTEHLELYFDGVYVYSTTLPDDFEAILHDLTLCKLTVWNPAVLLQKQVECYSVDGMVYNNDGVYTVSFPISSLSKFLDFDALEDTHAINIQGLLNYADCITKVFGSKHVEPLQLPVYMVKYSTVNLVKLPKAIKETHASGLTMKMLIANVMGKIGLCSSYDEIKRLRQVTVSCLSYNLISTEMACDSKVYVTTDKKVPQLYKK